MMTDTIADMLTRIRNANLAKHQIVQIQSTNVTRNIAEVLLAEGYIESFEELKNGLQSSILLSLKYIGKERTPFITKITRASKPGLRLYSNSKNVRSATQKKILSMRGAAALLPLRPHHGLRNPIHWPMTRGRKRWRRPWRRLRFIVPQIVH